MWLVTVDQTRGLMIPIRTGLDIPGALGPPYKAMQLLRPVITMLGLAILLVNTGDCVNLTFADAKAADCCLQADCPLAGGPQVDTCCKNPVSPGKYIQAGPHPSLSHPSVTYIDFPNEALADPTVEIARKFSGEEKLHAPPGGLNALFTPLLI